MKFSKRVIVALLLIMALSLSIQASFAQDAVPLNCGDIVQAETSPGNPVARYEIQAPAGTILTGRVEPIGQTSRVAYILFDAGDNPFYNSNQNGEGQVETIDRVVISSSNPILIAGVTSWSQQGNNVSRNFFSGSFVRYGAFTVYLGCELANGTLIEPGASLDAVAEQPANANYFYWLWLPWCDGT
jgi:hypothetical protein